MQTTFLIFISLFVTIQAIIQSDVSVAPSPTGINSIATYSFYASRPISTPIPSIPAGAVIKITFPSDYTLTNGLVSCTGVQSVATTPTCTISATNIVTIKNGFPLTVSPPSIRVNVAGIQNPGSSVTTGTFIFQIYDSSNTLIENNSNSFSWTPTAGKLTNCMLSSSSNVTGAVSTFTVSYIFTNTVPSGGKLVFTVPQWNDRSLVWAASPYCSSNSINLNCDYSASSNTITFTASTLPNTFDLISILNPSSTQPLSGFKIQTQTSAGNAIDECTDSTLTVTQPNLVELLVIYCDNGDSEQQVNQETACNIRIKCTNPLPIGANIDITFPSEFSIADLVSVTGISNNINTGEITKVITGQNVSLTNAVTQYIQQNSSLEFRFENIIFPATTATTSTFVMQTFNGAYAIDEVKSGVTYTAMSGPISNINFFANDSTIAASAQFSISFMPQDPLSQGSSVTVLFPSEIKVADAVAGTDCVLGQGAGVYSTPKCQVSANLLTVTNIFNQNYPGQSLINITVNGVTLPNTTKPTSAFIISTIYSPNSAIVDESSTAVFSSTPGQLNSLTVTIEPDSEVVGEIGRYVFSLQNTHSIPIGGKVTTTLPSEINIPDSTLSLSSCANQSSSVGTNITCTIVGQKITVYDIFQTAIVGSNTLISFSIEGIQNPLSLKPTSSFIIATTTSDDYEIDEISTGKVLTLTTPAVFLNVDITPSDLKSNAVASYRFKVTLRNIHLNTDTLSVTFPSDIKVSDSVSCNAVTNLGSSPPFVVSGQTVIITLNYASSTIPAGTLLGFELTNLKNPSSVMTTSSFVLYTQTADNFKREMQDDGLTITTISAATTNNTTPSTPLTPSTVSVAKGTYYNGLYSNGMPFPFIIFSVLLIMLILIGWAFFKETVILGNIVAVMGIMETIVWIATVAVISETYPFREVMNQKGLVVLVVALVLLGVSNVTFAGRCLQKLRSDDDFKEWRGLRKLNKVGSIIVGVFGVLLNLKFTRLMLSRLLSREMFSARVSKKLEITRLLNYHTLLVFIFSEILALIGAVITLCTSYSFVHIVHISIEVIVVTILALACSILEARSSIFISKATKRADDNTYGKVVPNDSVLNSTLNNSKMAFALDRSVLEKLNSSMHRNSLEDEPEDTIRKKPSFKKLKKTVMNQEGSYLDEIEEDNNEETVRNGVYQRDVLPADKSDLLNMSALSDSTENREFVPMTQSVVLGMQNDMMNPIEEKGGEEEEDPKASGKRGVIGSPILPKSTSPRIPQLSARKIGMESSKSLSQSSSNLKKSGIDQGNNISKSSSNLRTSGIRKSLSAEREQSAKNSPLMKTGIDKESSLNQSTSNLRTSGIRKSTSPDRGQSAKSSSLKKSGIDQGSSLNQSSSNLRTSNAHKSSSPDRDQSVKSSPLKKSGKDQEKRLSQSSTSLKDSSIHKSVSPERGQSAKSPPLKSLKGNKDKIETPGSKSTSSLSQSLISSKITTTKVSSTLQPRTDLRNVSQNSTKKPLSASMSKLTLKGSPETSNKKLLSTSMSKVSLKGSPEKKITVSRFHTVSPSRSIPSENKKKGDTDNERLNKSGSTRSNLSRSYSPSPGLRTSHFLHRAHETTAHSISLEASYAQLPKKEEFNTLLKDNSIFLDNVALIHSNSHRTNLSPENEREVLRSDTRSINNSFIEQQLRKDRNGQQDVIIASEIQPTNFQQATEFSLSDERKNNFNRNSNSSLGLKGDSVPTGSQPETRKGYDETATIHSVGPLDYRTINEDTPNNYNVLNQRFEDEDSQAQPSTHLSSSKSQLWDGSNPVSSFTSVRRGNDDSFDLSKPILSVHSHLLNRERSPTNLANNLKKYGNVRLRSQPNIQHADPEKLFIKPPMQDRNYSKSPDLCYSNDYPLGMGITQKHRFKTPPPREAQPEIRKVTKNSIVTNDQRSKSRDARSNSRKEQDLRPYEDRLVLPVINRSKSPAPSKQTTGKHDNKLHNLEQIYLKRIETGLSRPEKSKNSFSVNSSKGGGEHSTSNDKFLDADLSDFESFQMYVNEMHKETP